MPGVVLIVTGPDLAQWTRPLRLAPAIEGLHPVTIETLPTDKVRFHGDPVACVVAADRAAADDAAEQVVVDYEPLPAVTNMTGALAPGAPLVDETLPDNLVSHQSFSAGDPERAVRHGASRGRSGIRATSADPCADGTARLLRDLGHRPRAPDHACRHPGAAPLPNPTGRPPRPQRIPGHRDLPGHRRRFRPEDRVVSRGTDQSPRWPVPSAARCGGAKSVARTCWRRRTPANRRHGCASRSTPTAASRPLSLEIIEDFGAYCFYPANYLLRMVVLSLTGPYRITDYACEMRVVLTNKCGAAPMRAPMSIASWVMDGTIEAVARALNLDPIAVRRRNMLTAAELPWTMPAGPVLEDVTPRETLDAALAAFDVPGFRARQEADRARGVYRGMGLCCVVESNTYGSAFYRAAGIPGSGHEAGWVKVAPSGAVDVSVGLMASGQGYETALAQAAAEGLGVSPEIVRLHLGNTDIAPYGMGSRGARGGTAGSSVLLLAGGTVQRKACAIAAGVAGAELRRRPSAVGRPGAADDWRRMDRRRA